MSKSKDTNKPNKTGKQPVNSPSEVLTQMDELVERRAAINKRIADMKSEFGTIFSNRQRYQTAIYDLNNRLGRMPENEIRFAQGRQELIAELTQVRADIAQNEARYKELEEDVTRLETVELSACTIAVCAADVMEHHRQINQALGVVKGIQAAIDSQNQLIAKAIASIPNVTNRQQERYNLLADIAMGNASEKELKDLDAAISKEQSVISSAEKKAAPLIENGKATVNGLERKLAAANAALHKLESRSSEVAQRFFMGEAEEAAVQYVNNALNLKEQHLRLLGLDWIFQKNGWGRIAYDGAKPIQIPLFQLPQFGGLGNVNSGDRALLNGDQIYGDQIAAAADCEEARFDAITALD